MSRRKQSNPKPLLKNEGENQVVRDMAILQQDQADNSIETDDDEHSTVTSDDNHCTQSQIISELNDRKDMLPSDASPLSLETSSQPISACSTPAPPASTSPPIASPTSSSSAAADTITASLNSLKPSERVELPKLRLNITLASDPALQPEAKDIKCIRATTVDSYDNESNCDDELMRDESPSPPILVSEDNGPPTKRIRRQDDSSQHQRSGKFVMNLKQTVGVGAIAEMPPRIPAFICAPCGIKFSSLSTLEAHQTFYCSHSKKDTDDTNNPLKVILVDDAVAINSEPTTITTTKSVRTGKQYGCNQCLYSADKKVSLNRHMRMHQTSPTFSSVTSNGDDCSSQMQQQHQQQHQQQQQQQQQQPLQIHQIDRYCTDCDIRFSSTKTYRAHKQHYCSSRHRDGLGPPPTSTSTAKTAPAKNAAYHKNAEEKPKTPETIGASQPQQQPYLALPTTPILIIPYSLVRGANVLPGPLTVSPGVTNPDLSCFILQNGALQPIAQAITAPAVNDATTSSATKPSKRAQTPTTAKALIQSNENDSSSNNSESLKAIKRKEIQNREGNTTPLDLSVRRLSIDRPYRERSASISSSISGDLQRMHMDVSMDGKENLILHSSGSATPEQIVCAPSLPGSPPLTPSPKCSSSSPRGILSISPNSLASSLHLNQPNAQSPTSAILRPLLTNELTARLAEVPTAAAVLNAHSSQHHLLDRQSLELALNIAPSLASSINNIALSKTTPPLSSTSTSTASTKKQNVSGPSTSTTSTLPLAQPQIFVKQGVSKCKECNIVFCKYENYLAHKKHYCSARNLDENFDGKTKPSPPTSPLANNHAGNVSGTTLAYQQLICAACGIKFTSLDNLQAHQMYYCPKRIEIPTQVLKDKCTKCKTIHEISQPCSSNQSLYKCPICDVVSANAAESRKHLETHAGVKAFRCSICRYKGNTLRGMRTHIRMHFDKKSSDFNEENYISCILEEDGMDTTNLSQTQSAPTTAAVIAGNTTTTSTSSVNHPVETENSHAQQLHYCDSCNYSSTYKGNVMRHTKIVHSSNNSMAPLIGEGGESLLYDKEVAEHKSNTTRVIVKSEPQDTKSSVSEHSSTEIYVSLDSLTNIIKIEHTDGSDVEDNEDKRSDHTDTESSKFVKSYQLDTMNTEPISTKSTLTNNSATLSLSALNAAAAGNDTKYCHICDIKFNYLNTFIAHKKFYCKNIQNDLDAPSATVAATAGVLSTTRSSPNQASVVT